MRLAEFRDPGQQGKQPLRKPEVRTETLIAQYRAGVTLTQMEAEHGIARGAIKKRLVNAGVEILPPEVTKGRKGVKNGRWAGDNPSTNTAYQRAKKLFPNPEPCNRCGAEKTQRHHKDKNPANNVAENIEWLCASCHKKHHVAEKQAAEATIYSSTTPSGTLIEYSPSPRRFYRVDGTEVPSVTQILGVLDKSGPLTWWAQKVGVQGVLTLMDRDVSPLPGDAQEIVDLLVEHKLSVNHVKDSAADRGVNVHGALEAWIATGGLPDLHEWPTTECGYVQGLDAFMRAIESTNPKVSLQAESELMVGSLEHQYAGRFDLVLTLDKPVEVVTRHYPKRKPKVEEIPAGRYLMDLKTRKKASVYNTNFLQLEAYEAAAQECGYAPTDYRAVIVVTEDGGYQVSVNQDWCFEDFLAVRHVYSVLNEREVLRVLRDELNATEVK